VKHPHAPFGEKTYPLGVAPNLTSALKFLRDFVQIGGVRERLSRAQLDLHHGNFQRARGIADIKQAAPNKFDL
jgi:hypothetical protein